MKTARQYFKVYEKVSPRYAGRLNIILAGSFRGRRKDDLPILIRGVNADKSNLAGVASLGESYIERKIAQPDEQIFPTQFADTAAQ